MNYPPAYPQAPAPWLAGYPVPAPAPWDPYATPERRPLGDMSLDELLAEYAALRPAAAQARTQRDALDQALTEYRDRLVAITNVLPARIADEHDAVDLDEATP